MEVRVRYLSNEIAKSFGSSNKVETIHISDDAKYKDILYVFKKKLRDCGTMGERLMDTLVFICGGRPLLSIKEESLTSNCDVLVGYADTGS